MPEPRPRVAVGFQLPGDPLGPGPIRAGVGDEEVGRLDHPPPQPTSDRCRRCTTTGKAVGPLASWGGFLPAVGLTHRRPDGGRVPPRPGGLLTRPERLRPTPPTCDPDPEPLLEGLAMPAHTGSSPLTASSGRSGPETGSQTTEYALIMVVTTKIDHRGLGRRRLSAESSARGLGTGAEGVGAGGDGGPQRPDRMTAPSGRDGDEGHCRLVTHSMPRGRSRMLAGDGEAGFPDQVKPQFPYAAAVFLLKSLQYCQAESGIQYHLAK
jgi:hypothetical protein